MKHTQSSIRHLMNETVKTCISWPSLGFPTQFLMQDILDFAPYA